MASNSHLSYDDVRDALDRALASERGILLREESGSRLVSLRQRIHKLKSLDRKRSTKTFDSDDPRYGTSAYDTLSVESSPEITQAEGNRIALANVPESACWIKVVKRVPGALKVEEL